MSTLTCKASFYTFFYLINVAIDKDFLTKFSALGCFDKIKYSTKRFSLLKIVADDDVACLQ